MTLPGYKPCPHCAGFGLPKCHNVRDGHACTRPRGHNGLCVSCDVIGIHGRHTWEARYDGNRYDGKEARSIGDHENPIPQA